MLSPFAPGSRVVIRDEEWLIRRADPSTDGGWLLACDGISDLVRGRSALFLSELEDQIEVLDPAKTELMVDDSGTAFHPAFDGGRHPSSLTEGEGLELV